MNFAIEPDGNNVYILQYLSEEDYLSDDKNFFADLPEYFCNFNYLIMIIPKNIS